MNRHLSIRWILVVALLPLVALGLAVLVVEVYGLARYDPAYFGEELFQRYDTPSAVAKDLELALQQNDTTLLRELHGLRATAKVKTGPSIVFVMLWERGDRYLTYLYFDKQTYERYPHYVERVKGRWVVSPPDLYHFMHSGRWQRVFLPSAILWWVLGLLVVAVVWLLRVSGRFRGWLYGDWSPE